MSTSADYKEYYNTSYDPTFAAWLYEQYNTMYDNVYSQTSQEDDRELSPEEVEEARYLYDLIQAGEITQADLDYMESNFPELYNYAENAWIAENPEPELTQWQQTRDFIVSQVESGNASQANQDWYDRWIASGSPDTQDGMLSTGEYQWIQNKNTIIDRVESGNASQADQDWYDRWVYSGEPDLQGGMVSEEQYKDDTVPDEEIVYVPPEDPNKEEVEEEVEDDSPYRIIDGKKLSFSEIQEDVKLFGENKVRRLLKERGATEEDIAFYFPYEPTEREKRMEALGTRDERVSALGRGFVARTDALGSRAERMKALGSREERTSSLFN